MSHSRTKFSTTLAVVTLLSAPLAVTVAAPAQAAEGKYYSSCDNLHRDFKHGVARSASAANKQVRAGYGRPSTTAKGKAVYQRNESRLDRDDDGTACEA